MYSIYLFRLFVIIQCSILVVVAQEQHEDAMNFFLRHSNSKSNGNHDQQQQRQTTISTAADTESTSLFLQEENDIYFKNLVQRMKPRFLQVNPTNTNTENEEVMIDSLHKTTMPPYNPPVKQFYHLHHMKTFPLFVIFS